MLSCSTHGSALLYVFIIVSCHDSQDTLIQQAAFGAILASENAQQVQTAKKNQNSNWQNWSYMDVGWQCIATQRCVHTHTTLIPAFLHCVASSTPPTNQPSTTGKNLISLPPDSTAMDDALFVIVSVFLWMFEKVTREIWAQKRG